MFLFDNGKFQGVQEEEEKNPERVNINLINMIITLSLQVFFLNYNFNPGMCPAPWTRTLQGQNWSLLFWSKGFLLFHCQSQRCKKKRRNFMLCHEQFCFPRRQERVRHLNGEAARGMRTSRTLDWWCSELMMMMAAVEIRMRTSLMAIMIRCWKWWWWTG